MRAQRRTLSAREGREYDRIKATGMDERYARFVAEERFRQAVEFSHQARLLLPPDHAAYPLLEEVERLLIHDWQIAHRALLSPPGPVDTRRGNPQ